MSPAAGPLGIREPVADGTDRDLTGDGIRLRGTVWPGVGVPVLLLHGLAQQRHFWDLVVTSLRRDGDASFPVAAIDQRGHGDSDGPESGYDGATIARDAGAVLDALDWPTAVVVGHSWGAATALRLAGDSPDRVAAVVAIDGGFGGRPATVDRAELRAMLEPPRLALPPDQLRAQLREFMQPWWSPAVEAAVLPTFAVGDDGLARARLSFDRHMQVVDAMLEADLAGVLAGVRCPGWMVSCEPVAGFSREGQTDPLRGGWAAAKAEGLALAAQTLPEPRLFRWAGAVHDVPLQWPEIVAGLIRAAVADVSADAGRGVAG